MTTMHLIAYQTLQAHVFRMISNNMLPSEQRVIWYIQKKRNH